MTRLTPEEIEVPAAKCTICGKEQECDLSEPVRMYMNTDGTFQEGTWSPKGWDRHYVGGKIGSVMICTDHQ